MSYGDFFRIVSAPEDRTALLEVEEICKENFSSEASGKSMVAEMLNLFHEAFEIDNKRFLKEVFFENQKTLRLTYDHQAFIFDQWDKFKLESEPIDRLRQMQLVNLYRNIVSDLFDPYLSIIIACLKFKENSFASFTQANLSSGEFHKVEFAQSRLKGTAMFIGYNPIIRNAVSHSGTHSILYRPDEVIFRKIERTNLPTIKKYIKVSNVELVELIGYLVDFVTAVYAAINIFGIDVQKHITSDQELSTRFLHQTANKKSVRDIRDRKDKEVLGIWQDDQKTDDEKTEFFAKIFAENCTKNNLPAKSLTFKKEGKLLLINVPFKDVDGEDQQQINNRIIELFKYAILAEPLFNFKCSSFLVAETEQQDKDIFQVWLEGEDLKNYDLHEFDLYDLLSKAKIYRNKIDLNLTVDFEALEELELLSFEPVRKRI